MAVCPAVAATILVLRESGISGVTALLKRPFDVRSGPSKHWLIVAALIPIAIAVIAYAMLASTGASLPLLRFPAGAALSTCAAFLVAALFEELGWSGYATDPLQARVGALRASIVIGVVWAAWHWIPLLQAHRPPAWIGWWSIGTVGQRVLIVWFYNRARASVLAAALFHSMMNVTQLGPFQNFGPGGYPHDAIRASSLVIVVAAVLVAIAGRPRRHYTEREH